MELFKRNSMWVWDYDSLRAGSNSTDTRDKRECNAMKIEMEMTETKNWPCTFCIAYRIGGFVWIYSFYSHLDIFMQNKKKKSIRIHLIVYMYAHDNAGVFFNSFYSYVLFSFNCFLSVLLQLLWIFNFSLWFVRCFVFMVSQSNMCFFSFSVDNKTFGCSVFMVFNASMICTRSKHISLSPLDTSHFFSLLFFFISKIHELTKSTCTLIPNKTKHVTQTERM